VGLCHDEPSPPNSTPGANCPPGGTVPCNIAYTLTCRWVDLQAYCGDAARLEATVTPTPPDGTVTVNVLHPVTGATIDTLTGNMTGGRMQTTWTTKAQTANWRTDRIRFTATASSVGASGTSTNQFTFRQRPTAAWTLKNVVHASGNGFGPSHEKHDASLDPSQVHYRIKLKLSGAPFDAAHQTAARTVIQDVWNNGFTGKRFHRTHCLRGNTCDCTFDCCKAGFHLDVEFVATGEHLTVQVFHTAPGAAAHGSSMNGDGGEWGDPPRNAASTYAHETGHVLGQHDEYPTGAFDPTVPPAQPTNPPNPNLMSTTGNTTLFNRHYRYALAYLNANASGDTYETIPPGE
jgi:hypothetical protein